MSKKTTYHYIKGPVMFAKVFEHNRDVGEYAPEGGQYTIDIGVDEETTALIKSWNSNYKPKTYKEPYDENVDPDLNYFQFKRKHELYNKKGELIEDWCGAPVVVDKDGEPFDDLIWNGSICTIKLAVTEGSIPGAKGKRRKITFVRLEGVRVDVLMDPPEEENEEEEEVTPKKKGRKSKKEDIPF